MDIVQSQSEGFLQFDIFKVFQLFLSSNKIAVNLDWTMFKYV